MPTITGASHIALTVRDNDVSAAWYQRVLGFRFVKRFDTGIPRILLQHPESMFHVSLYNTDGRTGDRFSNLRTGLDHFALGVASDEELHSWIDHLDALDVDHSPVRDLGHARFVSLEDPDGVQIELWVTIVPFRPADEGATP
jgi:glyoxylase I family protein